MLTKYKHTEFFIASAEEFGKLKSSSDFFDLYDKYGLADASGGFEIVFALSRIFFHDENHIPAEITKTTSDVSRVFQYNQDFIEKIASFEKAEMDSFAYRLKDDEFCRKYDNYGMGIWVLLYELHDCCSLAIKLNKNLYLVEENSEYILER